MGAARTLRRVAITLAAGLCLAPPAVAQTTSRVALDVVGAADVDAGSQVTRESSVWLDVFGAVRISGNFDLRVRPVVFRRPFDGSWQTQMYELALRYERPGTIGVRLDGGVFPSPVGLAILENRPNKNPVVSQHSTLYLPVPRYEPGTPTTFLLAAAYPLGAKLTVSGTRWDARAAVVDSSPIRGRPFFGDNKPPRMANIVAGAGLTHTSGCASAWPRQVAITPKNLKFVTSRAATATQGCCKWKASGRFATRASPVNFSGRGASSPMATHT